MFQFFDASVLQRYNRVNNTYNSRVYNPPNRTLTLILITTVVIETLWKRLGIVANIYWVITTYKINRCVN